MKFEPKQFSGTNRALIAMLREVYLDVGKERPLEYPNLFSFSKGGAKMPKPSLTDKTFDELKELAQVGVAFMKLAQKYARVVDLPKPKRKRRRRVQADASKGNGADKTAKSKTRGKAPAVPKPQGKSKVPPVVKHGKAQSPANTANNTEEE